MSLFDNRQLFSFYVHVIADFVPHDPLDLYCFGKQDIRKINLVRLCTLCIACFHGYCI